MVTEIIAASATIAAAVVGGSVAFLSMLISKEHAVSEFRQKWIDGLRDDLSEFLSAATNISVESQLHGLATEQNQNPRELFAPIQPYLSIAYRTYHRIILRLNPKEHHELRTLVIELERSLSVHDVVGNAKVFGELCDRLSEKAHETLKNEWKRVKRGEAVYFGVKIVSGATFLVLLCWAGALLFI